MISVEQIESLWDNCEPPNVITAFARAIEALVAQEKDEVITKLRVAYYDADAKNQEMSKRISELEKEVIRLKDIPMKYKRMEFNAQLQKENAELRQQVEQSQQLVRDAALALINKLELVSKDLQFKAVFALAQSRGIPYTGPHYGDEYLTLKSALQSQAPIQSSDDAKDAERYRWILSTLPKIKNLDGHAFYVNWYRSGDALSNAIDAAMAKEPK